MKPKSIEIADSNLALFGSQVETDVKKASAETEPAWAGAGRSVGVWIWRIEKFQVVAWPKDSYGSFFSGDSYIILHTFKEPDANKLKHDLFFWLGKTTSQDEMGTAAYKTVELDTLLDDEPVQHRECQGYESDLFLELFKGKLRIMDGGIDSGFKHVEPEKYKPKLLHVKGKKTVRALEVPLAVSSLNSGDSFVLDGGLEVFVFQGKETNVQEKNKALEVARAITQERGKAKLITVNEGDGDSGNFWKILGASGPQSISGAEKGSDEAVTAPECSLYRLSDESGKLEFSLDTKGKISVARLDSKDAFILDAGDTVYVWTGKDASAQEKKQGMATAIGYLKAEKKNPSTPISCVRDGFENASFLGHFHDGAKIQEVRTTKSSKCATCNKFLVRGKCEKCGK